LKLDNKVLTDICTKAGITGKGSALASLTDEEAAAVKEFLAGGKRGPVAPHGAEPVATVSPTFRREDYIGPGAAISPVAGPGKVPVMVGRPEKPAAAKKKPVEETPPPAAPVVPAAEPPQRVAEAPPPAPVAEEPVVPAKPTVPESPFRSVADAFDRPVRPEMTVRSDKPPMLERLRRDRPKSERPERTERQGPMIKMAPMPASPPPPPKSQEPAPQKPDIKLPLDAIRASKAGDKPLSEHLRKSEQKRKATTVKKGGPSEEPARGPLPLDAPGVAREKRRKEGLPDVPEEEVAATLGGREQRQLKRKRTKPAVARAPGSPDEEETAVVVKRPLRIRRTGANTAAPRKSHVVVQLPVTIRGFSEAIGVPARTVLGKLLALGMVSTNINADLSAETAELLAMELGVEIDVRRPVVLEEQVLTSLDQDDDPSSLEPRPPVVTFLGHVDHGKTSLLDRILGLNVAAGEKGGITQHIRAYRIENNGRPIAFVDTPGHEAFTEMRARGANVTDIAVLVVAADDGVMPQTEEAISHARAAGVPIVVALNKMDLPGVNLDRIYQQLAANELLPSQWGGDVEVVHTSATKGTGISELLETLLTVAELHEYKANAHRKAAGTCLEAALHEGRGVVVKVLVQKGTLHVGDVVLCGGAFGRVKAMYDTLHPDQRVEEAGPATPVNLTGLNLAPGAGDRFYGLDSIHQARELAEKRLAVSRRRDLGGAERPHVTLESLYQRLEEDEEIRTLNIILRADVRGSIEAIRKELTKLEHPEVQIRIIQATVGGISEADVHLADASDAVIIGFNVVPDETARALAEKRGVQVRRYDIIYQVTDDLKLALQGMLKPEEKVNEQGRILVQRVYRISRVGSVAGCRVLSGAVQRDCRIRVIRDNRITGDYAIDSLKREKDDVREVREGMECGLKLAGFDDVKEGDVLEAYKIEEVARTF
jgi:translation initiation factor IF-2